MVIKDHVVGDFGVLDRSKRDAFGKTRRILKWLGEDPDNSRGYSKLNALASLTPHESKYRVLSESMLWLQK
jgi:hypothetical protein